MNETDWRKAWETLGKKYLDLYSAGLEDVFQAGYWERSVVVGILGGPVIWSIIWVGIVLNVCVFTVETISSRCSPSSILAAFYAAALTFKGILWLSLIRQSIGKSVVVHVGRWVRYFKTNCIITTKYLFKYRNIYKVLKALEKIFQMRLSSFL